MGGLTMMLILEEDLAQDAIIPVLILILAPVPVYYFLNWILSGFKKDKRKTK